MINGLTLCLINTEVLCWVMVLLARHTSIYQSEALLTSTILLEVFRRTEGGVFKTNRGVLLHYIDNKITKECIKCILWVLFC